jgi:hypothetical protein
LPNEVSEAQKRKEQELVEVVTSLSDNVKDALEGVRRLQEE